MAILTYDSEDNGLSIQLLTTEVTSTKSIANGDDPRNTVIVAYDANHNIVNVEVFNLSENPEKMGDFSMTL